MEGAWFWKAPITLAYTTIYMLQQRKCVYVIHKALIWLFFTHALVYLLLNTLFISTWGVSGEKRVSQIYLYEQQNASWRVGTGHGHLCP